MKSLPSGASLVFSTPNVYLSMKKIDTSEEPVVELGGSSRKGNNANIDTQGLAASGASLRIVDL
jgi:hypothetical protein